MIALPFLLFAAAAPPGCTMVKPIPAERAADSAVIRRTPGQPVRAGEISEIMASGRWKAVWATPKDAERGVYFLRRDTRGGWQLVKVWGGVIAPDERAGTIAWARKLGKDFPAPLATCFVDGLIAGK